MPDNVQPAPVDRQSVRCIAAGRVQGVGYRWFACSKARGLGLDGAVRNLSSGQVEIWFRGDPTKVAAYLSELRQGPRGAEVTSLEILKPEESTDYPRPFRILATG